jgi:hypothetical protein
MDVAALAKEMAPLIFFRATGSTETIKKDLASAFYCMRILVDKHKQIFE